MGLLEKMRQFVGRLKRPKTAVLETQEKKEDEAIQSPIQSLQSLDKNDSIASIAEKRPEKIKEKPVPTTSRLYLAQKTEPILDKDSFQVGLAAGYTGKSIKEIERSLDRIESQMITKDWFNLEFEDLTPELIGRVKSMQKGLEEHDSSVQERFKAIQAAVEKMEGAAEKAPEPLKEDILKEIKAIKAQIPLSPKMKELIDIVKLEGEINYEDLAKRLGVTVSALRGLLSNTLKRTDEIERFKKAGRGWVRYRV